MKKLIVLLVLAGVFTFSDISAQTRGTANSIKIGVGADFAIPAGRFQDFYNPGVGGTFQLEVPIVERLDFIASAGFITFNGKQVLLFDRPSGITASTDLPSYSAIPVAAGLRVFLLDHLYVGGELGAAFDVSSDHRFGSRINESNTSFLYGPHIGIDVPVANKRCVDVSLRYQCWKEQDVSTNRFAALRVAYNFGL